MGDAERAALAETMDRPGARQQANRPIEIFAFDPFPNPRDRGRRRIGEPEQEMGRIATVAGILMQRLEAFRIVRPAIAQSGPKHLLEIREAGEAQGLGEPHQGRCLDLGAAGDGRGRSEGDLVRMFEGEGRRLAKALGQMRLDVDEAALERLEGLRRLCRRVVAHDSPPASFSASTGPPCRSPFE